MSIVPSSEPRGDQTAEAVKGTRLAPRRLLIAAGVLAAGLVLTVSAQTATPKAGGTAAAVQSTVPAILGPQGAQPDPRPHGARGGLLRVRWSATCPRDPALPQILEVGYAITDQFGGKPVISGAAINGGAATFPGKTRASGTFKSFVFLRTGLTREVFREKVILYCGNQKVTLGTFTFRVGPGA